MAHSIDWQSLESFGISVQEDRPDIDLLTICACLLDYLSDTNGEDTVETIGSSRDMELIAIRIDKKLRVAEREIRDVELWEDTYLENVFDNAADLSDKQIQLIEKRLPFSPDRFIASINNLRANGEDVYLTKFGHRIEDVWKEYKRLMLTDRAAKRIYDQIVFAEN